MELLFNIQNSILTRVDKQTVVTNSKNYVSARFNFSDEWIGKFITVYFKRDKQTYPVLLDDLNSCRIPNELFKQTGGFRVGISGVADGVTLTTNNVIIEVHAGDNDVANNDLMSLSLYEQILNRITKMQLSQIDKDVLQLGIEQYLIEHPIDVSLDDLEIKDLVDQYIVEHVSDFKPKDGVGIEDAYFDNEHLILRLTDGRKITSPSFKGNDGVPGHDGLAGQDGHTPILGEDYFTDVDKAEIRKHIAQDVDTYFVEHKDEFKGQDGQSIKGDPGKDGYSPIRGVDYYTDADKEAIAKQLATDVANYIEAHKSELKGKDGESIKGDVGQDGLSAYGIAVKNGFVGTEQQFIASLKGKSGEKGDNGLDGITPDITMEASIDSTSSIPSVSVTKTGTKENPIFDFVFGGLTSDNEQDFVGYSPYANIQDYYDDMLVKKTGPMLRTDTAVVNPFSFGAIGTANELFNESLSKKDYVSYKYFYWCDVETTEGNYDFSSILTYLKTCYNEERYAALRVFPNTGDPQRSAVYTINGTEYFSACPFYVVNKMANKTTKYYYNNKYLITDFNDSSIRDAYKNLISAFGTWLNSTTFEANGVIVNCKDLVLFVDMGIFGPWGEGEWYTWRATSCTISDLVSLHSAYLTALPNIQCNLSQIFKPVNLQASAALKSNAIFANAVGLETKKLYNNVGHVGFKIDNIGSNHPLYDDGYLDALQLIKFSDEAKKWADRGDFFSGEFAMWTPEYDNYHGHTGGEFALKTFKMFRSPFVLIHNMTDTYSSGKYIKIPEQEKKIWLDLCRAVSSVGARFVITPMSYNDSNVVFKITNIGLTAPKFDLYELKVRVRNLDNTDEYMDIPTSINLTSLAPECDEPLIYSTNGHIITTSLSSVPYTNYSVSILGIDRLGYSRTLKFSNYDVNKDGSYLICKIVSGEPIFPSPELMPLNTSSLWSALHYAGVKNLLPYSYSDGEQKTSVGMTFTVKNGIVTVNGTSGEDQWAVYWIAHDIDFNVHEPMILSTEEQLPKGVEIIIDDDHYINTYTVGHNTKYTLPEEATTFRARIVIHPNTTIENLVIKPMLRLASDLDDIWQPPTPTNKELASLLNAPEVKSTINLTDATIGDALKQLVNYGAGVYTGAMDIGSAKCSYFVCLSGNVGSGSWAGSGFVLISDGTVYRVFKPNNNTNSWTRTLDEIVPYEVTSIAGEYLPTSYGSVLKKKKYAVGATSCKFYYGDFADKYGITSTSDLDFALSAETASGNVVAYTNVSVNDNGKVVTFTFDELTESATFACKASKIQ